MATQQTGQKIPLVDLKAQYATIKSEIDLAIDGVINRTAFVGGPDLKDFEEDSLSIAKPDMPLAHRPGRPRSTSACSARGSARG